MPLAILYHRQGGGQFRVGICQKRARFFQDCLGDIGHIEPVDLIDRNPVQIFQFPTGNERLSIKFRYMIAEGDKKRVSKRRTLSGGVTARAK